MRSLIRSRRVALPLAALALTGTGVAAYGAVADDGVDYRTVAATTGSVEQELTLSGVIAPSGRSDLAFGTDGTVARVRVAQGDEVEEGDVIAVLDRASLRTAVDRARSDLATATARLAQDRDAQATEVTAASSSSSSSGSGSSGRTTSGTPSTGGTGSTSSATAALVRTLHAQQDAVVAAQSAAGDALATAGTALSDQQAACADPVASTTGTATDTPTGSTTDGAEPTATTSTTAVLSEACATALTTVQSAQSAASAAQTALQAALETLGGTLTDALGSVQSGSSTPPSAQPTAAAPAASSAASSAAPSSSAAGPAVTAATLAQDQASIDRARADLVAAKADLAGAVVRAPADGTVVSLAVATNADVSAGDTVATVVAPGLTTVSADVGATQAAQLEQGTDVEVTPAGATEALAGSISRVEHVASSDATTGSDPTYAVEVVLDERDLELADGMPASVRVVVGSADDVVVVPASAVEDGSVTLLDDEGRAQRVRVTTGIVGATQIEVTDGLEAGDVVVLADLDAELPTGDSGQQTGPGGGFGGGGGGFPAGGPPSGGGFPGR